ncbi:2Fe-2S iron-sulfur cluster-binding protein [Cobetia sp. MMG027]|uniref:2Fe-2S iron-sulfur cluster-binding protein n=1 Tax=Cobetia sp. MMG027 TaxID=3021980 RepID=UPI0022FDF6FA|nr:2Fe-2S iron-sulfur cluster-binding protein [Cobetia sp. MMG027]MDA5564207.1 2Fe-2S iron-sulfur cluster-binding protein [Cobetia sp. MMG027]
MPERYVDQVAPYVRDQMPEQHVAFFESLPVLFMGVPDTQGWPWAVVSFAAPGQLCDASPGEMRIHKRPALTELLALDFNPGTRLGVLGLDVASRRRNRLNGTLLGAGKGVGREREADEREIEVDAVAQGTEVLRLGVDQSFGNCPQYIQLREIDWAAEQARPLESRQVALSDEVSCALLAQADTFFIATRAGELEGAASNGVDVSHRGGRPGFVNLNADGSLSFPDFAGNRFFNTLGNIELDSRVSLLIPDFTSGAVLVLKGRARVDWNPQRAALVEGAERIVDVVPEQVWHVEHAMPAQERLIERSPSLEQTGDWPVQDDVPPAFRRLRVIDKVRESDGITSFFLGPLPGRGSDSASEGIVAYQAGQFLTLRLASTPEHHLSSGEIAVMRSYSLSQAWHADQKAYRISVRRDPVGIASRLLHDEFAVGDVLEALPPAGDFVLQDSPAPVVLLSSGVGITPMIAMLQEHVQRAIAGNTSPGEVYFVHAARDGSEHAFVDDLTAWAQTYPWLHVHIAYSRPRSVDLATSHHQTQGRLDMVALSDWLPDMTDCHVYLCGSEGFMRAQYAALMTLGLPRTQLHHEFFGRGSLEDEAESSRGSAIQGSSIQGSAGHVDEVLRKVLPERAQVTFTPRAPRGQGKASKPATNSEWTPQHGTLLELAEQSGVEVLSSCRSGRCGTCALRLVSGEVQYPETPQAAVAQGQVLMCCAYPAGDAPLVIQTW